MTVIGEAGLIPLFPLMSTCLLLIRSLVRPVILTDTRNIRAFKAELKLDTQRGEESLLLNGRKIITFGPFKALLMNQMNYKYKLYHAYRL